MHRRLTGVLWRHSDDVTGAMVEAVDLSCPPGDNVDPQTAAVIERARGVMKKPGYKDFVWVHIPSNNILWAMWAMQHLPRVDDVDLVAIINEALEEEEQSKVLMWFTIITVVFTPLNFVAAWMAIPTRDYPHDGDNIIFMEIVSVPGVILWSRFQLGRELFEWSWKRGTKPDESVQSEKNTKAKDPPKHRTPLSPPRLKGDGLV
ncbi:hypothetical protein PV04_00977 [Phialophora macrospora]|uniref:Uncharacterized protein n=1 Tax=Phialophora macrospora TaxID=1851006 RepID=A0A0D2G1X9_9EURO|nr:hypothetical protein PV04_00977 [Phialophora macrospora]